jgi:hypothetical protein
MPPLKEVKFLVRVSNVDCQATWLRIAPTRQPNQGDNQQQCSQGQ